MDDNTMASNAQQTHEHTYTIQHQCHEGTLPYVISDNIGFGLSARNRKSDGYILMKENFFTGRIKVVGRVSKLTMVATEYEYKELRIHDSIQVPDDLLYEIKNRTNNEQKKKLIDEEINYRNSQKVGYSGEAVPETEELKSAIIKVKDYSQVRKCIRRISPKFGIKFRWPWQSFLVLKVEEDITLDTQAVEVEVGDDKIVCDIDFTCRIINPERYISKIKDKSSTIPLYQKLNRIISDWIRDIAREADEDICNKNSEDFKADCGLKILNLLAEYGLKETNCQIQQIQSLKNITNREVNNNYIKAEGEAKASRVKTDAETYKTKAEQTAKNEAFEELVRKCRGDVNAAIRFMSAQNNRNINVNGSPFTSNGPVFSGYNNQQSSTTGQNNNSSNGESNNNDNNNNNNNGSSKKELSDEEIKQFYLMGFCDEDGYLSRSDSKFIMRLRGEELEAGKVLSMNEISQIELIELNKIVEQRENESENQNTR